MNIKKLSLLSFLLFASAAPISAIENETTETGTNKQEEKITWSEWLNEHPFTRDATLFTLGALYTGSRVWLDHSEPTLKGFLKSSGKRVFWQAVPLSMLTILVMAEDIPKTPKKAKDFITNIPSWSTFFAHAAYREVSTHKIIGPTLSAVSGSIWLLVNKKVQNTSNYSNSFHYGQLFGSLLGVGLRYRHDFGSGIKQTPGLVRQIPAFIHSAIKHLPFKNRPFAPAIG